MSHPLVAIATPVYNGAEFLAETMESVQAQTYPNCVHVIVDNASTDETPQIIERYRNGRVPLLVKRNDRLVSQVDNFNLVVDLVPAEAKYIRVLCGDDLTYPESIAAMTRIAEENPNVGVVGCNHFCDNRVEDFRWPTDREVFSGQEAVRRMLLGEGTIMAIHLLFRKSISDMFKPLYPAALPGGRDLDAMVRLLMHSDFGFAHMTGGFTRLHENSETNLNFNPATTRAFTRDAMLLMTTYGPWALGKDYPRELKRFLRYYMRRIVAWKLAGTDPKNLQIHYDALQASGVSISPTLVIDSLVDWGLFKLGMRPSWTGYPGYQP